MNANYYSFLRERFDPEALAFETGDGRQLTYGDVERETARAANVLDSLGASVPFPKRLGDPKEFASMALEMARNGYINGHCMRLDGAIRMAPR